jgi:hypothetical protein
MEQRDKMSEQEKIASQITALERAIASRTVLLKDAQAKWEDWKAGNLRAAIGRDQIDLHNLKTRRASMAPAPEGRSTMIFYGSNS